MAIHYSKHWPVPFFLGGVCQRQRRPHPSLPLARHSVDQGGDRAESLAHGTSHETCSAFSVCWQTSHMRWRVECTPLSIVVRCLGTVRHHIAWLPGAKELRINSGNMHPSHFSWETSVFSSWSNNSGEQVTCVYISTAAVTSVLTARHWWYRA